MGRRELVLSGVEDGIAGILLNAAATGNAWSPDLATAYHDALAEAGADPSVRVVVVTGAGETFATAGEASDGGHGPLHTLSVPKPVVAAVNGPCTGEGLVEALLCDVRFGSTNARFAAPWVRHGRPVPGHAAWLLARIAGVSATADLLLSGRELDATEATAAGLLHDVLTPSELMERALAYAGEIARNADAAALGAIKAQLYRSLELGLSDAIGEGDALAARFGFGSRPTG